MDQPSAPKGVNSADRWGATAAAYHKISEAVHPHAQLLIEQAEKRLSFTSPGVRVLDNGCGTGAVCLMLAASYPKVPIVASDLSPKMTEIVSRQGISNIETVVADGMDLSKIRQMCPEGFSHVLSNFMIQFAPDPFQPIQQMITVTRPGGVIGLGTWGSCTVENMFISAVQLVYPEWESPGLWSTRDFPEQAAEIKAWMESQGIIDVETLELPACPKFSSVEEFTTYFFESKNPAPEKLVDSIRAKYGDDGVEKVRSRLPTVFEHGEWDVARLAFNAFITVGRKP
ncbi:hypothetical protein QQS21_010410 [Conoideocrella luteorostrata]|uniref:Methyltransferase domain-containing protein n=1 Tax=Conoideocrella luteorostrata TaxID=1105319 RepID=A0AAJ0CF71_9HYPO|nr:hypothetical protein QQS21_010410 [Conoideocrella luteorostrata]